MSQIIHASPKVRKFARQLGADISQLKGSERNGRITEDDVRNFIKNQIKQQENTPKKSIKDEKNKLEFDHGELHVESFARTQINLVLPTSLYVAFVLFLFRQTHYDQTLISFFHLLLVSLECFLVD